MKQVIFLDFDGVINSVQSATMHYEFLANYSTLCAFKEPIVGDYKASEFCPVAVSNLNYILKELPNLKVVVSSFWRRGRTIDELKEIFYYLGLPAERIISKTPTLIGSHRGEEIQKWLETQTMLEGGIRYAIVDDDTDMLEEQLPNYFHIDNYHGLLYREALKIIDHFRKEEKC